MAEKAIDLLRPVPGVVGEYVSSFLDRTTDDNQWRDEWFRARVEAYFTNSVNDNGDVQPIDVTDVTHRDDLVNSSVRIKSVQPNYFRGFKELQHAVDLIGDLVIVEGGNSSGKSSLCEALEFLFTGELSRRIRLGQHNAPELENYVGHRLRPDNESTWVEATFVVAKDETEQELTLRRKLIQDYGSQINSTCESQLLLDGQHLSADEEHKLLNQLIAGQDPLLTQHTLQEFVYSSADDRSRFFESLLRLDELTRLIEISVIGDSRLREFESPNASNGIKQWDQLEQYLHTRTDGNARRYWSLARKAEDNIADQIEESLLVIGREIFATNDDTSDIWSLVDNIGQEQLNARQTSFPLLEQLRPTSRIQNYEPAASGPEEGDLQADQHDHVLHSSVIAAWEQYYTALSAIETVGKSKKAIHHALELLKQAGLIDSSAEVQMCPICEYDSPNTLTSQRVAEIDSWQLGDSALNNAGESLENELEVLHAPLRSILEMVDGVLPSLPEDEELEPLVQSLTGEVKDKCDELIAKRREAHENLKPVLGEIRELIGTSPANFESREDCEIHVCSVIGKQDIYEQIKDYAAEYRSRFDQLEKSVATEASKEPEYQKRQAWLECAESVATIADDINWENYKLTVQREISTIRERLIDFRGGYLEARRSEFNDGMTDVWKRLREDRYSAFSELRIPKPSRRGFRVRLEVKATLDDGRDQQEVDALGVFSESQVNALGIAAFVTRARLLGHRMIVLDDPVQSMDEDHFKSFARELLPSLLANDLQLIIMTHSDEFAREVSLHHIDRGGYVTLDAKATRSKGCLIEEGNRRVAERLKRAEKLLDNGHIRDAWTNIRRAIERLYLVSQCKHGPSNFDPKSWEGQTADYMWNAGADDILESKVSDAGHRLKEIVDMTAGGAHDKAVKGETDVRKSVKYIRELLDKLRLGAG